ncbi:MAG: TonB-dependent receptor [Opitutales bacterium]|nr:TonB-dependent receptor [Opitutales bacterium]
MWAETPLVPGEGEDRVVELEAFEVRSFPLSRAAEDYAQPATVVSGRALDERAALSLGQTLDGLPGVSATGYFPGASRPIIRGFSNDRIRVLSDGVDTFDASVGSLDHAVAVEPIAAERVEIVRGPATLLYGSNAVGGVVNVIDARVPRRVPAVSVEGAFGTDYASAADGWTGRYTLRGRAGESWAWQSAGLMRRHGDVSIPGFGARDADLRDQQERGTLRQSFVETEDFTAGVSRFFDTGFGGVAYSHFSSRYGIGQEVEEEVTGIGPDGEPVIERELDDLVMIDLERWRVDGRAGVLLDGGPFSEARLRFGFGGYEHAELEDGEASTFFRNDAWEGRLELTQRPAGNVEGALGFQVLGSQFEATGDEAFLRPTDTRRYAVFAFEELDLGRAVLQFGARMEHQRIRPEFYERDEIEGRETIPGVYRRAGVSGSAGTVVRLRDGLRITVAANYTERLPNAQELYADGPHVGTFAYEISDHVETGGFRRERAVGVDAGLRGRTDRFRWEADVFYVRFGDYIQLRRTDELAFENEDETFTLVRRGDVDAVFLDARAATGEGAEFLPVTRYVLADADYYGFEFEGAVTVLSDVESRLDWRFGADYVRAGERGTGEPLARIPPLRLSTGLDFAVADWEFGGDLRYHFRQNRVPDHETAAPGFAMFNLRARWTPWNAAERVTLSARLENALNREARDATSFVRDLAPRPGRNLIVGIEVAF